MYSPFDGKRYFLDTWSVTSALPNLTFPPFPQELLEISQGGGGVSQISRVFIV